jgi:hypothetical protein
VAASSEAWGWLSLTIPKAYGFEAATLYVSIHKFACNEVRILYSYLFKSLTNNATEGIVATSFSRIGDCT